MSAHGPEYVIQAYYKYRPASYEALALLVCADSKDRLTQVYITDMLRLLLTHRRVDVLPPRLTDIFDSKQKKTINAEKAETFVDDMIHAFRKGAGK